MAEFLITAPDGKKYKVTGATREGALAALKRKLNTAPVVKAGDTSMGTAFNIGDAQTMSGGARGMATLNRLAENSFIGKLQKAGRDYGANPIREFVGLDPLDTDAINRAETDRLNKAADAAQAEADRIAEETNFQNLTTADIKDIPSFVNFVLQKTAQSAPQMAASIGSFGYATYPFSVGGLADDQEGLEGKTQEEKDRAAATGGIVMTALENLGLSRLLPKNATQGIIGGIADGVISEGVTEGLQELISIGVQHSAGKEFTQEEILERLKESIAAGSAAGGTIKAGTSSAAKTKNIFTGEGKVTNPEDMDPESAAAAGAFARRLRQIANANNYDLGDVGASSDYGARATIDKAHVQLSEALKDVFQDLNELVKPDKQKTFRQNRDRVLAQAAYREAKNKTKSTVGQQELDAIRRLVGDTAEGQEAINLMLQLNQMTELHNAGYKGGLSRFTDVFNPVDQNINSYDGASRVVTGTLSPLVTAGTAYSTGGASLIPQAALFGTGRAVDKMTGRRSTVDRYVRQNEGNSPDLPEPTAPSLVETQNLKDQLAQDEALRNEAQQRQLNLQFAQSNAAPTQGSPQYTLEDATGLSRAKVAQVLRILKGQNKNPALTRAIADYERSVAQGGIIDDKMLSPLIRAVKEFQEANTEYVPIDFVPNSLSRPELAQFPTPDQKVQLDAQGIATPEVQSEAPAQPQGGDEFGPQFTTPQNYNRGIQDNLQFNRELQDGAALDNSISRVDRGRIITSLENLTQNLGSSPVDTVQTEIQKLTDAGVPQEAIDTHVQPYVDRVISQQRRNTPKMAMAPQEDAAPAVDPKKPQAPLLPSDQIPTQTRKIYKLMKVQKSRPNEVLPLFAKSGGHKGPPSGYNFNKWYASEFKRPKLGAGLLAPRSGIHGVNLPVFDQGKAKVKGEQRVWVEAEIPSINPETQAQSDNSFNPKRKANDGILNRVLDPNESYDYKTNPNASNDAGGWPIAGSVKILRIVPDNEIAQVLSDNGLDHQVDNSFTGIDAAKAQELMQPATPVRMAMAQEPLGSDLRISTRFPTQKASTEDPVNEQLIIDIEAMKSTPAAFEHNMDLVTEYVNFPTSDIKNTDPDAVADTFKKHIISNLLFLHDQVPQKIRDRSKKWYDGAREITTKWAGKYNIPDTGIAGALAALSPQKDWYQNVSLAERVLDVMTSKMDTMWTDTMSGTAATIFGKPQYAEDLVEIKGKTLKDVMDMNDDHLAAMWIRTFDEAHNDRRYRTVSSEGKFIGNPSGKAAWGSLNEIGKAVSVIRDPSYENVTVQMGARHKVRNFYNNIISPNSNQGDVTIDTHAVAAGLLRPLSGNSTEVVHNFGTSLMKAKQPEGYRAAKASGIMGAQGLYGLYADAYREAAAQRGLKPRELQSITWEAVRGLFPAKWKQKKNVDNVNNVWSKYKDGGITLDQARKQILDLAGGIDDPTWYDRSNSTADAETGNSSYEGELDRPSVAGDARGVDSGTRRGNPRIPARPALAPVQDNVAGVLAQRIEGGPTRRTPVPSTQEVKQAAEPVRQAFSVGLKGSEFEDGIKNIDQVRKLADAIGITLNMYDDHLKMSTDADFSGRVLGLYQTFNQTAYAMSPVKGDPDIGDVSEFQSYIYALHEVAHGVNDMTNDAFDADIGVYNVKNAMTKHEDEVRQGSFDGLMARIAMVADKPKHPTAKVVKEIKKLQDKGKYDDGSDIRYKGGAKRNERARRGSPYYNYIRNASEFAVDPVVFYLHNPKRMKKEFPETAKMISQFFAKSGKINFYSHPLAMAIAAVLAMMMKAEQEEEQMNQMPAGVLNQPMPMGALSQA